MIVDSSSNDLTARIIKQFEFTLSIRLISAPDVNIAKGRNLAVANSRGDIIASTDAGCVLDSKWFENITKPMINDGEVQAVTGMYLPMAQTEFEGVLADVTYPDPARFAQRSFLPSARSIAFRRRAFFSVGGFPEWLDYAEDTYFDIKLKKSGIKFHFAKDAIVYWMARGSLKQVFHQYYRYAKGDGRGLLFPKRNSVRYLIVFGVIPALVFLEPFGVAELAVILILGAVLSSYLRKLRRISPFRIALASAIGLTVEVGTTTGYVVGVLARLANYLRIH